MTGVGCSLAIGSPKDNSAGMTFDVAGRGTIGAYRPDRYRRSSENCRCVSRRATDGDAPQPPEGERDLRGRAANDCIDRW
eukprot:2613078-Prymnesium_polylepis.1